jgi:hypothetical protein
MKEEDKKAGKLVFQHRLDGYLGSEESNKVISGVQSLRQTVEYIDEDIPEFKKQIEKDLKERLRDFFQCKDRYKVLVNNEKPGESFEEIWKKAEPEKEEKPKKKEGKMFRTK